jgi:hypothetical protein
MNWDWNTRLAEQRKIEQEKERLNKLSIQKAQKQNLQHIEEDKRNRERLQVADDRREKEMLQSFNDNKPYNTRSLFSVGELVNKAIYSSNGGISLKRRDIINWIEGYTNAVNKANTVLGYQLYSITKDQIDGELQSGQLFQLLGPDGPIANNNLVEDILSLLADTCVSITFLVEQLINSHPEYRESVVDLLQHIQFMIDTGYIESDNKLRICVSPNVTS